MTAENYAGTQEALKGSPELRRVAIEKCVAETNFPAAVRREAAFTMKVRDDANLMKTFCTRLVAGMASGRLAYEDLYSTRDTLPPKLVRVLQQR